MKKLNFFKTLVATGLLILSTSAWSYTIDSGTVNVGSEDTWLASTNLSDSSIASETTWVDSVLGFDVNLTYKNDSPSGWATTDQNSNVYAIGLSTDPAYYLLKLGSGGGAFDEYHLFQNETALNYAVFDLTKLAPPDTKIDIGRISHISEFNGTTNTVPEPGSIALLGIGLIGLGLLSRRAKKNQA